MEGILRLAFRVPEDELPVPAPASKPALPEQR